MRHHHPVALVTGAAHRIGAAIARYLHGQSYNIIIHYRNSKAAAQQLCDQLNATRAASAAILAADLTQHAACEQLITNSLSLFGQLDVLINNASSFFPTPIGNTSETDWDNLMGSNVKGPFFLTQAAAATLKQQRGCVINITDTHAQQPLGNYPIYSIAKAGLTMLTKSFAKELAPWIRVNAIAPGNIAWPEGVNALSEAQKQEILQQNLLKKQGSYQDITLAVDYLLKATFVTGEILFVNGGRLIK